MKAPAFLCFVALALLAARPAHAEPRRVAVLDFANTARDPAVDWLGPAVAETLTTKLHAIRGFHLVERLQIYRVLQEQKLALNDLVDPSQAVTVGKLVAAEQVVLGAYAVFAGTVRFTARFVDTATGIVVATSQVDGALDRRNPGALWSAFDRLALAAIESLNIRVAIVQGEPEPVPAAAGERVEPTAEEWARLAQPPAASLEAQEAFGRGSSAYKRDLLAEAASEFARAAAVDPAWGEAWYSLASALEGLGKYPEALGAAQTATKIYVRSGNEPGQTRALALLGRVLIRQGRYPEALGYFARSLRLAERRIDLPAKARVFRAIAGVRAQQGRYADALAYYDRALVIAERLGMAERHELRRLRDEARRMARARS
ncbi:MAG: tetratricopeptide repeat protein [Candidatus Rokubacteria bacterium]|nr:tetratricopeptide repeat protein [Candidatus Rokubacteria bacterium]